MAINILRDRTPACVSTLAVRIISRQHAVTLGAESRLFGRQYKRRGRQEESRHSLPPDMREAGSNGVGDISGGAAWPGATDDRWRQPLMGEGSTGPPAPSAANLSIFVFFLSQIIDYGVHKLWEYNNVGQQPRQASNNPASLSSFFTPSLACNTLNKPPTTFQATYFSFSAPPLARNPLAKPSVTLLVFP
ncbi:hypothetical protein KSP40_PGU019644 [Platanthera guangdongensis]|uniref:Uncharacterized protein n=1 Tax=Platanthera guangdongensis TaxID=2320717 RepID=A0ABR2MK20_9ASPA